MNPFDLACTASISRLMALCLIILGLSGCGQSTSPSSAPTAPTILAFPLVASGIGRYLQDQNGMPFPILGRTAWFITSLPVADYKMFIDDSVAKGYNAIEFHVVNHDPRGNMRPFNGNGDLPFLKRLDGAP